VIVNEVVPAMNEAFALSRCTRQANRSGLLITDVQADSGAASAGIRGSSFHVGRLALGGDIITAVNHTTTRTTADLQEALEAQRPGDTVRVTLLSCGGEKRTVRVMLGASDLARG
jgi:S1-C subfamily serine protease